MKITLKNILKVYFVSPKKSLTIYEGNLKVPKWNILKFWYVHSTMMIIIPDKTPRAFTICQAH